MFKHILLPTDGSKLSEAMIREGVRLAKMIGARVTGFCVVPQQQQFFYDVKISADVIDSDLKRSKELAQDSLSTIENLGKKAGITYDLIFERNNSPSDAIIRVAKAKDCDLIMMASHGRRGVAALLVGSETRKVLTHSKIPVLVYR